MRVRTGTLVLVADGRKMRLFKNTGPAGSVQLTLLLQLEEENPPSREHGSDAPGRTHSSHGERRSSYSETDWHDKAEADFSIRVAMDLETAADKNSASDIIVIAGQRTLGNLRKHYGRTTQANIKAELNRDLVNHSERELVHMLVNREEA